MSVEATIAYQEFLAEYATLTSTALLEAWDALTGWDRVDAERFARIVTPVATGSARATTQMASGFHQIITGESVTVDAAPIIARLPDQLLQPFTTYWHELDRMPWDEAIDVGRSTTEAVGRDIVHQGARDSMVQIDRRAPSTKWRRVLTGTSCKWCQFYSTRLYNSARTATFGHKNCDCLIVSVAKVDNDFADEINESVRIASGYDEQVSIDEITRWGKANPSRRRRR